jgi:hypothetical protein
MPKIGPEFIESVSQFKSTDYSAIQVEAIASVYDTRESHHLKIHSRSASHIFYSSLRPCRIPHLTQNDSDCTVSMGQA